MTESEFFSAKVVWITGASSGIGEALVYRFALAGATVIASSQDIKGLERVKASCSGNGTVTLVPFDLEKTGDIEEIVRKQVDIHGRIDYLLNIGGISQRARIEETPMWLHRKIFEINYFGTVALSSAVLPYMIAAKSGFILATSSISGRFGFPLRSAYSASKQALHGYIETLYLENRKDNIRASVIIPGRVKTSISFNALEKDGTVHGKMDEGQAKGLTPDEAATKIIRGIMINRREILVGKSEMLMLHIRRYLPWLFFRIADRIKAT